MNKRQTIQTPHTSFISNKDKEDKLEFRVIQIFEGLETELVQDFDRNVELQPENREGFLFIEYRLVDDKDEVKSLKIKL